MFEISLKLSGENPDYERLHPLMESHGFSRLQRSRRGVVFYAYKGDFVLEEVYALVVSILAKDYKQFCVFVHELDGGRGLGLAG